MSSSSWPRWRCRGRCSPRSCAGSSACEGRPLRRPDASGPWGGKSRGDNRAPRSTRRAKENRIGSWTEFQRLFPAEISRRTCPRVDRGSSEEQGFGCRPSPSGEYRLDTAKAVFQVHGVDESGRAVLKRKLRRNELVAFFAQQARCTVIIEACGAGHHWARLLTGLGHEVKLSAPEAVRPFVKKGKKNDAADAAALCVAGSRPEMRFVPIKSVEQQAVLALHTVRSLLVKQQTMLANALRGLAAEFGLTTPKGMGKLAELIALVSTDESLPAAGRRAMAELYAHGRVVDDRLAALEAKITSHARHDETARRLATIPGIGPITASLIAATVGDNIGAFRSARHFAAWLGLVPRQHSTGGKVRLGRITKAGNAEIRKLLVLGATSMVRRATLWNSKAGLWVQGVLARRPVRLVTVALANKMARIAWALITRKQVYQAQGHALTAAEAAA